MVPRTSAGASLNDAAVPCSSSGPPAMCCERLEDFLDIAVDDVGGLAPGSVSTPAQAASVESMEEQLRCALQEQSDRLGALYSERMLELAASWEARLESLSANMDAERAEKEQQVTLLHQLVKEKVIKRRL